MGRVVKLTHHGGQYRITIPRELLAKVGLGGAEFVKLSMFDRRRIVIEEYYGKGKDKRDLPADQS